jgi:protein TonB
MALALSLNLVILLFLLEPSTPFPIHAPLPQSLLATLRQPPPVVPLPAPILRVVPHVAAPNVRMAVTQASPIAMPALPALPTIAPVMTTATTSGTDAIAAAGDSDATIAYETATPPAYPIQALRGGIEGTVLLKVLVDPSGKPVAVTIAHSSGSRLLDDAARRHVLAAWRFHPAIRDGHVTEAWALVPVKFGIDRS